jgi:hypothetical protein
MNPIYNIPFRNDSGEEIPAYAVMRVDEVIYRDKQWLCVVKKPDAEFGQRYLVNGPGTIQADGYGQATDATFPAPVAIAADDVEFGDGWGVLADSWTLHRWHAGGFVAQVVIEVEDDEDERALFRQLEVIEVMAVLDEALEYQDTATASIVGFETGGTTHDSGGNVTAYDGLLETGRQLPSGATVYLTWTNGRWVATRAKGCDEAIPA